MAVLEGLEPVEVFKYFEEICSIPHGSSNTKKISDYCVKFAKSYELKYIQDEYNNVIIFKNGTKGYEKSKPVIIQGHMDMVCEKEKGYTIDMDRESLKVIAKDDMIMAEGTTLGGDDGIAVAYALALLASADIPHPPLEVVFTVDEEIGMLGAAAIDCSALKGNVMLNLDSEEEGYLLVSCAGGVTANCHILVEFSEAEGEKIQLMVTGLQGGHSGVEIDKGRANSNQIMGRILYALSKVIDYEFISVNGGLKDNAIPRESVAEILIDKNSFNQIEEFVSLYNDVLKNEYKNTDKDICIIANESGSGSYNVMNRQSGKNVITALVNLPGGIQKMSSDITNLVQTSLNLGILKTTDKEVKMSYSVRSSVGSEKKELISRIECLMEAIGGFVTCTGEYPAWEYKKDSILRELMSDIYKEQMGKEAVVQAIHAGVECGLFADKIQNLDCVSFGPDILDIHTPSERMSIRSVERTWKFILEVLKRLK